MKYIYAITAFLCAFISLNVKADPITLKQSQKIALRFVNDKFSEPVLVNKAKRKSGRKLASQYQTVSPYYIYSRGEGLGFVIVSGDDALPEVLGYTESGDFNENDLPPFLTWYLDYYGQMIEAAQAHQAAKYEMPPAYAAADRVNIAPLIKTHWHQDSPYNDKCPTRRDGGGRCVTGCVATAASQVAYYWWKDLPSETQAPTSSYRYGDQANPTTAFPKGTPLKWELMLPQYGSEPIEYRDAVATLLAVVGGGAGLTYGSSTSGYNDNCRAVFSNILGLNGGNENAKDWGEAYNNYSDEAWSTLLYNDLSQLRPVLYSGCNTKGEGHAVVVDGYQASTGLFHFNLGWGNPGAYDGYFTVARGKSPSWGFNDSWQECVTNVFPKKQNLKASIDLPRHIYKNRTNTIKVKVANNGTLDYSGIYLFSSTSSSKPSSISTAKDKDDATLLKADGTEYTFRMNVKPTNNTIYLTLTDKRLNIISQMKVSTEEATNEIWFSSMRVDGSSDKQGDYSIVYNDKASAYVEIENKSAVSFEGLLKLNVYGSNDNGETFELVGTKSGKIEVPAYGSGIADISLSSTSSCPINKDKPYYIALQAESSAGDVINFTENPDTTALFILKGADMDVISFNGGCLALKGHWDVNQFNTIAKKTAYKIATSYDLAEVSSIGVVPAAPLNPNAVYYVNDENATGHNVIYNGICKNLILTPGYRFDPRNDFTATMATVDIAQQADKWYLLTAPCQLSVPNGMVARRIESHGSTGISNKTTDVRTLEAGHTYLLMTSSSRLQEISGENAPVSSVTVQNVDTAVVGTYANIETPAGSMLINFEEAQYFVPVEEGTAVEALRGYFNASNVTKEFRAYSSLTVDPVYLHLAEAIETSYNTIDEYRSLVFAEANKELLDSIQKAEQVFTEREYETKNVKLLTTNLLNQVELYKSQIIDPEDGDVDFTTYIQNPSFESGKIAGWTVEDSKVALIKDATQVNFKGVGADGKYLLYSYKSTDSSGCEIRQDISGLPAGYYKLTAMVGTEDGHSVTLFANDKSSDTEAHPYGKFYLTEASVDSVEVGEGSTLTIGVKAGHFYKVDDFHLTLIQRLPTDISDINADDNRTHFNDKAYDLSGRAVDINNLSAGVYIINGKKKIIR